MLLSFLSIIAMSAAVPQSYADHDAAELLRRCDTRATKTLEGKYLTGWCTGFIEGVAEMVLEAEKGSWHICVPANATVGDMMDSAVAYLRAHPDEGKYSASTTIITAWQNKYSCEPNI